MMETETGKSKMSIDNSQNINDTFKIMAENAPVMVWMADVNRNRYYFNKTWLDYRGKTLEEENNDGWIEGIHPDDRERSLEIYHTAFKLRQPYKKEYRLKRKDNKYRWILSQGTPLIKDNLFYGYIGSCMDINYRVEQEEQKDEFIAIASHELKTPLTSIKIYTQLLHQTLAINENPETTKLVLKMDTQVDRLTWLITEMLDMARVGGNSLQLIKEYFDLNCLIGEVVEDMQTTTNTHKLEKGMDSSRIIWGDKERIRQVLVNLLSNAIKYSPEANRVIIHTRTTKQEITVSIRDFGIGIPENKKDRIFERFFRANDHNNTFPGIGLGLYISSEIIKRQNGKIWYQSEPGKGSEFSFLLPLAHDHSLE